MFDDKAAGEAGHPPAIEWADDPRSGGVDDGRLVEGGPEADVSLARVAGGDVEDDAPVDGEGFGARDGSVGGATLHEDGFILQHNGRLDEVEFHPICLRCCGAGGGGGSDTGGCFGGGDAGVFF